ncbi:uncharacterized protein LOC132194305 isoform X1 [Neocloeon triangulifer]|uniref:uncharacterized protein LOC132194305 isoform X1 n=1 Tax=Neocloeon triangulifer TaxID=2078957 RepID=UPI00286EB65E|nr:uncharacterized protein LOC132194305 isoform X1 [Neocloeon triangulifer]
MAAIASLLHHHQQLLLRAASAAALINHSSSAAPPVTFDSRSSSSSGAGSDMCSPAPSSSGSASLAPPASVLSEEAASDDDEVLSVGSETPPSLTASPALSVSPGADFASVRNHMLMEHEAALRSGLKFSIDNILRPEFGRLLPVVGAPVAASAGKNNAKCDKGKKKNKDLMRMLPPSGKSPESSSGAATPSQPINLSAKDNSASSTPTSPSTPGSTPSGQPMLWPAWVYCTRYSDRPSSAVLRLPPSGHHDQSHREWFQTGHRQSDGADGASSVRGPAFPVWQLLAHYGCFQGRTSRAARRRIARRGCGLDAHEPARFLLLPHGLLTTRSPTSCIVAKLSVEVGNGLTILTIFLGTGLYLSLLLLTMGDIESNPGPLNEDDKAFFLSALDGQLNEKLKFTNENIGALKTTMDDLVAKVEAGAEKVKHLESENAKLSVRVTQLENRLASHEADLRRKNLVVFGVPTATNLQSAVGDLLFNKLKLPHRPQDELLEATFRIGKEDAAKRPVILKFKTDQVKFSVMKNVANLKGTGIVVSDDLTPEERKVRRKLVEAHKTARKLGVQSKLRRRGLELNGHEISAAEVAKDGWLRKYVPQFDQQQQMDGESEGSSSDTRDGRPKQKRNKKRNRAAALLSPNEQPSEPQAGGSQQGFASAPPNSKSNSKDNKAKQPPRGQSTRSLDRLRSANSKRGSDSDVNSQN